MPAGSQPKPGPFASAVSDEIRLAMTRHRVNGVQLAALLGRSQTYVATRLRNELSFTANDVEDACRVLEEDLLTLLRNAVIKSRQRR